MRSIFQNNEQKVTSQDLSCLRETDAFRKKDKDQDFIASLSLAQKSNWTNVKLHKIRTSDTFEVIDRANSKFDLRTKNVRYINYKKPSFNPCSASAPIWDSLKTSQNFS